MVMGPSSIVLMYEGYDINAYTFYMRKQDAKSTNQNSGVQIKAYDSENHAQTYYGFIEEIWELDYGLEELKVPLFWCKWVRVPKGIMTDKYGMRTIDFKHLAYLDGPFIFVKDVVQVFYGKNQGDGGSGHVVLQGKRKIIGVKDTNKEEGNGN